MCGAGFVYGESECWVSFCLVPGKGGLSPSEPTTPELFSSSFRARDPERTSDSHCGHIAGSVDQNLGSFGIYPQRSMAIFLTFPVANWNIFWLLSCGSIFFSGKHWQLGQLIWKEQMIFDYTSQLTVITCFNGCKCLSGNYVLVYYQSLPQFSARWWCADVWTCCC